MFVFHPAVQTAEKARIVLDGLPGAGVTPAALRIARGLVGPDGIIGVVDTQRGAALRYAEVTPFLHLPVDSFSPGDVPAITVAAVSAGVDCLIVDSFTSYWSGRDGMLNLVDRHRKSPTQSGWAEARPVEQDMMDALLGYPGHLIVTLRVKSDIVVGADEQGNPTPLKIALKPEHRDGLEYDFHLSASLDLSGALAVTSTCAPGVRDLAIGAVHRIPGEELGGSIADWLGQGAALPTLRDYRDIALDPATTSDRLRAARDEVEQRGMSGLTVADGQGKTGPLLSLIYAAGRAAVAREQAAQAAAAAVPAPEAATPAPDVVPAGAHAEPTPDNKATVAEFVFRVASASDQFSLDDITTELDQLTERSGISDNDRRIIWRALEQRRCDLNLPYGQPRQAPAENGAQA